jgi:hypothetical protein
MARGISLLVGNGLNQLTGPGGRSWQSVLEELAKLAGRPELAKDSNAKPFAILYEAIVAAQVLNGDKSAERLVKENVAHWVAEVPRNDYHERVESLGWRHILTTNYDYNLGPDAKSANLRPETKFSVFRRRIHGPSSFWMMHGEVQKPDTIMLGYEHYAGAVQKLRNYLYSGKNGPLPYSSPFMKGEEYFESLGSTYSWVDVFLRDDIHILGLGLDYTEIELWWLIAFKARLKREKVGLRVGSTTFYHIFRGDEKVAAAKTQLLESLGVTVHFRKVQRRNYAVHYNWALDELGRLPQKA